MPAASDEGAYWYGNRRDGGPWKHMILLLTDEVPCPPKSRTAVILVCGSSWLVPVLDVLHLRLTASHFFCCACLGVCVSKVA